MVVKGPARGIAGSIGAAALAAMCLAPGIAPAQGTAAATAAASGEALVLRARHVCIACHGEGGRSAQPTVPSLAAQPRDYLANQLKDFRGQIRVEAGSRGYMWGISALLDDATIAGLADYFAAQPPAPGRAGDPALAARGRTLYTQGVPARQVPACSTCHGDAGEGGKVFPRLAGQQAAYVVAQLKEFGTALRPHALVMRDKAAALTEEEMRAVAEYVQSMPGR